MCLQSFCGRHFSLGNCPITSIYFREHDSTLICSTYSVSAVQEEAVHRGWPLWPGLKSHRTTKGWSQTVLPKTTLLDAVRLKLLDSGLTHAFLISWDFLEAVSRPLAVNLYVAASSVLFLTCTSCPQAELGAPTPRFLGPVPPHDHRPYNSVLKLLREFLDKL